MTAARRSPAGAPASAVATARPAARRFRSHSHGPMVTSSKSLRSSTMSRWGVPNRPKLSIWASPFITTSMPLRGPRDRSQAMTCAAPRRNAKGEDAIRATRSGIRRGCRPRCAASIRAIGSGRSGSEASSAWDAWGTSARNRLPAWRRLSQDSTPTRRSIRGKSAMGASTESAAGASVSPCADAVLSLPARSIDFQSAGRGRCATVRTSSQIGERLPYVSIGPAL